RARATRDDRGGERTRRRQPVAAAGGGGFSAAQSAIGPEPVITSPLSSTRIGTPRCPLSCSTSARSRARDGHVQNFSVPPLTFFHSYWNPASSSAFAARPQGWAIGPGRPPKDLPSAQV